MFSVRIVTSDHYMGHPIAGLDVTYSSFRGAVVKKVPVIRIFGTNNAGEKTLLHVHGVFPYVYVPCADSEPAAGFPYRLASALDHALNVSLGQTSSPAQHVFKVVAVTGTPFYGYHSGPHVFYKLYLYSPTMVKRAADLLQNGAVLNTVFQVHDAHVPFVLKFFIDYNLRGMDAIRLAAVRHRRRVDEGDNDCSDQHQDDLLPLRVGVSRVEVDAIAEDILNRRTMSLEMNPGLLDIWEEEKQRRRGEGKSSQIGAQASQARPVCHATDSEVFFKKILEEKLRLSSSQGQSGGSVTAPSLAPYPAETPEHSDLLDASFVEPHVTSRGSITPGSQSRGTRSPGPITPGSQSQSLDDSVVMDSQDALLADILVAMEQEGGGGASKDDSLLLAGGQVDDDSILGSQSQRWPEEEEGLVLAGRQVDKDFLLAGRRVDDDSILGSQLQQWPDGEEEGLLLAGGQADEGVLLAGGQTDDDQPQRSSAELEADEGRSTEDSLPQLDGPVSSPEHSTEYPVGPGRRPPSVDTRRRSARHVPAVDGGLDSDGSSSDEAGPAPTTPKRRRGSYRPLEVKIEKSPKGSRVARKMDTVRSPRKATYGVLDVKCDKSPRRSRLSLNYARLSVATPGTSESQPKSGGKQFQDVTVSNPTKDRLLSDDPRAENSGLKSRDICDSRRSTKSDLSDNETNCDRLPNVNNLPGEVSKNVSSENLSFLPCQIKNSTKCSKSEDRPNSSLNILNRRISLDLFGESNSPPVKISSSAESSSPLGCGQKRRPSVASDGEKRSTARGRRCAKGLEESRTDTDSQEKRSSIDDRTCDQGFEGTRQRVASDREKRSTARDRRCAKGLEESRTDTVSEEKRGTIDDRMCGQALEGSRPSVASDVERQNVVDNSRYELGLEGSTPSVAGDGEKRNTFADGTREQGLSTSGDECSPRFELLSDDDIEDSGIVSFYDNTHVFSSSDPDSDSDEPPTLDPVPRVYAPAAMPPTRSEVMESLSTLGIPRHRHQEPFYGDPSDATEPIEVGHRRVALSSVATDELQPFRSSVPGVVGLEDRREGLAAGLGLGKRRAALAGQREVTLVPCLRPPSYGEAEVWQRARALVREGREGVASAEGGRSECEGRHSPTLSPASPPLSSASPRLLFASPTLSLTSPPLSPTSPMLSPTSPPLSPTSPPLSPTSPPLSPASPALSGVSAASTPLLTRSPPAILPSRQPAESACKKSLFPSTVTASEKRKTKKKASQGSNEDRSLHRLLLQSQFRAQLATPQPANSSGCQIEGVHNNTYEFAMSLDNLQDVKAVTRHQYLTIMALELHTQTRGELRPDPAHDPIRAVFYVVTNDVPEGHSLPRQDSGVIIVGEPWRGSSVPSCPARHLPTEQALLTELVAVVGQWDPDIMAGYETEMLSWGYLVQRAAVLQMNLCPLLSRVPTAQQSSHTAQQSTHSAQQSTHSAHRNTHAADGDDEPPDLYLVGRIVLNVWRLMKGEIALMNYSFENVLFHVLHRRVPLHSFKTLSHWWEHPTQHYRSMTAEFYTIRVHGIIQLMDQLDLIGRTSELARLFGIQFYEVLSRGSQFRVESMMLRLTQPHNYVPVSPSIRQRAQMRAPEHVPLILEPESRFYADPVIVLDFQSLYPSIIIAYNYCFSTCLGRVQHLGQTEAFDFGCTRLRVPPAQLARLIPDVSVAPCGVAFVRGTVRAGVLPRMLSEILDTRLMVKQAMKEHKLDRPLQRVLHARQLGLKLIANVTYGYTAANFSGRMPCAEVADSVVSKGRETLERAVRLVDGTERWGARVVYGDTDSLFVLVAGRSREEAFEIGAEIAEAVTEDNPRPVKLKLEKVYQPCILQTKKRYVGYMYESADQTEPLYEAKGIETVRRDGCPAVAKVLGKCLRLLFDTRDVSLVKRYTCRQLEKLLRGRANLQDLIFAREYRGMAGYKPGACVPALELTRQWLRTDKRAEPRSGQRVPYVIVNGPPGMPLIRLVRSPHDLMVDPSLSVNAAYYITGAILPPLARCFSLLGADVHAWYAEMPRKLCSYLPTEIPSGQKKSTIAQYFVTMNCVVCGQVTNTGLCAACRGRPQSTTLVLCDKLRLWERSHDHITKICQSCCGRPHSIECRSLDCPILFRKYQSWRDLEQAPFVRGLLDRYTF